MRQGKNHVLGNMDELGRLQRCHFLGKSLTPNPSLLQINDQECDKILSIQRV